MENRKKPRSLAPLIFFTSHYFPFSCCELHPEKLVRVHPLLAGRILFLSNTYRKEQENAGLLSRFSPCCSVHLVLVRISHAEKEELTDGKINTEFPNKALFLFWKTNNCVIYFKFWGFLYLFTFWAFFFFVCLFGLVGWLVGFEIRSHDAILAGLDLATRPGCPWTHNSQPPKCWD